MFKFFNKRALKHYHKQDNQQVKTKSYRTGQCFIYLPVSYLHNYGPIIPTIEW